MKNLTEVTSNKMLKEIVDRTVREAVKLQKRADSEYTKQKDLEEAGKPYNFTKKHTLEEGARALAEVLWTIFGGMPINSINAIRTITRENNSPHVGGDSQDYVTLFLDALQAQ